jgi:hypothetical protein
MTNDAWSWFNILEVKEQQERPFFFTAITLEKAAGQAITWTIEGRQQPAGQSRFDQLWTAQNATIAVPLGEWFTLEYYIRRDVAEGRIMLAITVGDARHVVFDFDQSRPETVPAGFTTMNTAVPYRPLEAWEIMKTYVGPPRDLRVILGEPIDAWYDDLEIWSGLPAADS